MAVINIEDYKYHLIENEKSERTIKSYVNTLKQLNDYLKSNGLNEITKNNLIDFKAYLKEKYTNVSTLNGKIVAINIWLKWRLKEDYFSERDGEIRAEVEYKKLCLKHFKQQSKAHRPSPNENEYKRLCKNAVDDETLMFIYTIGNTGLRISEIVQYLKYEHLDKPTIQIDNKGKTRTIALPMWLRKELKQYFKGYSGDEYLFKRSQPYYRDKCKKTAAKAKVNKNKVYPHGFRHYFAKKFLNDGGDSLTLQQMLGHESSKTTEIYVRLDEEELAEKFRQIKNK